jgi:hypothetical protein
VASLKWPMQCLLKAWFSSVFPNYMRAAPKGQPFLLKAMSYLESLLSGKNMFIMLNALLYNVPTGLKKEPGSICFYSYNIPTG